jgi:hypothetical protein
MAKFGVFEIGVEHIAKATFEGDYMMPIKDTVIIEIRKKEGEGYRLVGVVQLPAGFFIRETP